MKESKYQVLNWKRWKATGILLKETKKELYIIDEKLKNDQMSLKKIVHCDIVSTVEQRS